jgi:hypothetical protein
MAQPTTRTEFTEWCLRKLGKPVIEINVDEDQVSDRIDESLSYYWDYHFDGAERTFLKHVVTEDDKTNKYITVPENIIGVINLFDIGDSLSVNNLFNIRYQFALNDIYDMSNYSLTHYMMAMQHIQFIEELLVGKQPLRYNRHINRLYIDMDWGRVDAGQYIIAECYSIVDPNTYADVWKDRWLQNYATAKIKYQWGSNLTKFTAMQLPGGVTFNGEQILQDALAEIQRLEEEMISSYSLPVTDMTG